MKLNNVELLKFANSFADLSKSILKKYYFKNFKVEEKTDGTLVTEIDKKIESKFRSLLKRKFPSHGVIGEEFENYHDENEYVWIIDPLDGTHSFISGKPLFGTLICCMRNKTPIIGLIDIPIMNQRWFGAKGFGVQFNSKKCKIKKVKKKFRDLIMCSTSLLMFNDKQQNKIKKIYEKVKIPVFGTDCYAYGLLLSGKVDLIVEANMKPWDYMAQTFLIKEFGGCISDWNGNELNLDSNGKVVASYDPNHHKTILGLLNEIN